MRRKFKQTWRKAKPKIAAVWRWIKRNKTPLSTAAKAVPRVLPKARVAMELLSIGLIFA